MSKGRGWNRGERSDQIQLNIVKKELAEQKAAILARFEKLWGLHEQTRQVIANSWLYEWHEPTQEYLQVGKTMLKALLSGEVRFGWPESRVVQVLGDTLDRIEDQLAHQDLALKVRLSDERLLYMRSFRKLFFLYLEIHDEFERCFRLRFRHEEVELRIRNSRISFQYNFDCLWYFLNLIQQIHDEQRDKLVAASFNPLLFSQHQQREVQKAYLEQLLGWELPASE